MFQVGDVLSKGWEGFKNNVVVCVVATLIYIIIAAVIGGVFQFVMGTMADNAGAVLGINLLQQLINVFIMAFFMMGFITIFLKIVRNEEAAIGDLFSNADKIVVAFLVQLIIGIATAIGSILLIVPGVIIGLGTILSLWFVVDQNMGVGDAIKASWAATNGSKMTLFVFFLAAIGLMIVGAIPCGLGLFVVAPMIGIALGHVYETIKDKKAAPADGSTAEV